MDDYKTDISFEGKNGSKKEYKEVFLGMSLWIAAKYTQIHHQIYLIVESYFLPSTLPSFGLCSHNRTNTLWEYIIPLVRSASPYFYILKLIPFGNTLFPWLAQPV